MVFLKKVLVPAVILCMTMFIAGCGDDEDDNKSPTGPSNNSSVVGTWESDEDALMVATLTFSANNTFVLTMSDGETDDTYDGTYTVNGNTVTLSIDGESTTATVSGNKMNLDFGGFPVELTKK